MSQGTSSSGSGQSGNQVSAQDLVEVANYIKGTCEGLAVLFGNLDRDIRLPLQEEWDSDSVICRPVIQGPPVAAGECRLSFQGRPDHGLDLTPEDVVVLVNNLGELAGILGHTLNQLDTGTQFSFPGA